MKSPNELSILFFGDCVGKVGRRALAKGLPLLKDKYQADFVICNCENATHGRGCSHEHYLELLNAGADCLTSGNHFYDTKDVLREDLDWSKLVRPLNLGPYAPLKGSRVFRAGGHTIRVTNLLGLVEMHGTQVSPFIAMDELLPQCHEDFHIVDIHAEATGEKRALAEYLDGKVNLVTGTHTHVQTNDAKILEKGTCFISDAGMCGLDDSCLGMEKHSAMRKIATGLPIPFNVPESGRGRLDGIHCVFGPNFKGVLIEKISVVYDL